MSDEIRDMCYDLEEAGRLSCDELGEWWQNLAALRSGVIDCGSEEFTEAYEKQIRHEHARLQNEFEIVEEERIVTQYTRSLKHESEL